MKTIRYLVALCVAVIFSTPSLFAEPPQIDQLLATLAKLHTPKGAEPKLVAAAQSVKQRPQRVQQQGNAKHRPVVSSSSNKVAYHTRYVTEASPNRAGHRYSAGYIQANGPSGIYVMSPSPNTTCPQQGYRPAPQMHYVYNPNPPPTCSIR